AAGVPLKVADSGVAAKFGPVMVTDVPTGPEAGEKVPSEGGIGSAPPLSVVLQFCGLVVMEQLANEGVEKSAVWVVVEVVVTVTLPAAPTLPQVMLMLAPDTAIVNGGFEAGNCACILFTKSDATAHAVGSWLVALP